MDTRIFTQDLSVPAVSAYILAAAIESEGGRAGRAALRSRWNASDGELEQALAELLEFSVLTCSDVTADDPVYRTNPFFKWGPRRSWPPPRDLPVFPESD